MSKTAWIIAALAAFVALLLGGAGIAWYASPTWLPKLAQRYAPIVEVDLLELELDAPRLDGVHIKTLRLRRKNIEVNARAVDVAYLRQGLTSFVLRSVHIDALTLTVGPVPADEPSTPLPDPRALWQMIPVPQVTVSAFSVAFADADARLQGSASFSPHALDANLIVRAPATAAGYSTRARLSRAGALQASIRAPAPMRALIAELDAQWLDANAADGPRVVAHVRAAPTPAQVQQLSSVLGIESTSAQLRVDAKTTLPWPLPDLADRAAATGFVRALEIDGGISLAWRGKVPGILRDGQIDAAARIRQRPGSVDVQLAPGMLIAGELITAQPLMLFAQEIPKRMSLQAKAPLTLQLNAENLRADGVLQLQVGSTAVGLRAELRELRAPLSALVGGQLDGVHARTQISLELPKSAFARMSLQSKLSIDGVAHGLRLQADRGTQLSLGRVGDWSRGDTRARITQPIDVQLDPRTLAWRTGRILADVNLPRGDFGGEAVRLAPAKLELQDVVGSSGSAIDARGTGSTSITARRNSLRVHASGSVSLRGDAATTRIALRLGKSELPLAFVNDYDLARKRGRIRINDNLRWSSALFAGLLQEWPHPGSKVTADSSRGNLRLDADLQYRFEGRNTHLQGTGSFALAELDAVMDDFRIVGLDGRAEFDLKDADVRLGNGELRLREAFIGTDLKSIETRWRYADGVLTSLGLQVALFGGKARTNTFDYGIARGDTDLQLTIDGIQLADVLALQHEDLAGTGVLDGELPVRVRGNVAEVAGGRMAARPPGGAIAYAKASEYAQNISQPGFQFAISALSDFRYTTLSSSIDYDREHVLKLGVKLYGHNPIVEEGHPINYNLNVSQNVSDLLRSLRAADEVSRRLEDRLQRP